MNQKLILVISLLAGIAAFGLSMRYFRGRLGEIERARAEFEQRTRKIAVVVAATDIPQGVAIGKKDIARDFIYAIETSAREDVVVVQEASFVLGRKTLFSLKKGDPLYWSFLEGGGRTGPDLASAVTPGLRAISLPVSGSSAVSGLVLPNDHVDVLGTFSFPSKTVQGQVETVTQTILQDVTVLATGQELANDPVARRDGRRRGSYSTVTLEVTPREAELLVFAEQLRGRITMSLRNPSDVSFEHDLPSVDFNRLEDSLPELNLYRQRQIRHRTNL
jgi:pilus assembly protein CpaB